ncbi:HNH endonuclease [Actinacidiphila oryziradicis]|uniref:HNH endonuclease n=1 Tax=Actinacidiphila oryziradicis TaxID=2571141 RepID=UPI003211F14C|nr:hypothetical protein [Actinacidiphila oryziradicis]
MDRICLYCLGPLPQGSQRNRQYCSKRCSSAASYRLSPEEREQARLGWLEDLARQEAAEQLARTRVRDCEWCGKDLPSTATGRRRFCDVACKNRHHFRATAKERVAALQQWRLANPDKYKAIRVAYKDQIADYNRRYARANPEVFWNLRHLRRARLAAAGGPGVSASDWRNLLRRWGHRCAYCGTSGPMTMDHIVPISLGGWHAIGNVIPACKSCNSSKSNQLLIRWRRSKTPRVRIA